MRVDYHCMIHFPFSWRWLDRIDPRLRFQKQISDVLEWLRGGGTTCCRCYLLYKPFRAVRICKCVVLEMKWWDSAHCAHFLRRGQCWWEPYCSTHYNIPAYLPKLFPVFRRLKIWHRSGVGIASLPHCSFRTAASIWTIKLYIFHKLSYSALPQPFRILEND